MKVEEPKGSQEGHAEGHNTQQPVADAPSVNTRTGTDNKPDEKSKWERGVENVKSLLEIAAIIAGLWGFGLLWIQTDLAINGIRQAAESNAAGANDTIAALNVASKTANAAKEAAEASVKASEATQRLALAAEVGARATRGAFEFTEASFRIEQQPWLTFFGVGLPIDPPIVIAPDKMIEFKVHLINSGKTPALDVRPFGCSTFGATQALKETVCPPLQMDGVTVMAPGATQFVLVGFGPYTSTQLDLIKSGTLVYSTIVGAHYSDQFGSDHFSRFCKRLDIGATVNFLDCVGRGNNTLR
jgi:hypothetical protein